MLDWIHVCMDNTVSLYRWLISNYFAYNEILMLNPHRISGKVPQSGSRVAYAHTGPRLYHLGTPLLFLIILSSLPHKGVKGVLLSVALARCSERIFFTS